jgi:hypothetical protein
LLKNYEIGVIGDHLLSSTVTCWWRRSPRVKGHLAHSAADKNIPHPRSQPFVSRSRVQLPPPAPALARLGRSAWHERFRILAVRRVQ